MSLSEQAKKARNEYAKKWRLENKDKQKQYTAKYWERVAEKQHGAKGTGVDVDERQ